VSLSRADLRNMSWLLAAQAAAALTGILAFTRIGRELPIRELGRFGFVMWSTALFGLLAELGIRYAAMREIAVDPSRTWQVYRHGARARWLLAAGSLAVLFAAAQVGAWRAERDLLLLGGLVAVTQFGSDPGTWVLFGRGRVDLGAVILVVDRLFYLTAIHVGAWLLPSAEGLVLAALLANLSRLALSGAWLRSRERGPRDRTWDPVLFRRLLVGGSATGVAVIAAVAYSQGAVVLVKAFRSPEELGYFSIAFGIVNVLLVVPMSLTMALFPTLAAGLVEGPTTRRRLADLVARLTLVTALPLAVALLLFGDAVLALWMGARYLPASQTLSLLAIALPLSALSFMFRLFLFAANRFKLETILDVAALAVLAVCGVPLAQARGITAVAWLLVALEAVLVLAKLLATRDWLGRPPIARTTLHCLLAVAIPTAIVVLLERWNWYERGVLLALGISVSFIALGVVPWPPWRLISVQSDTPQPTSKEPPP